MCDHVHLFIIVKLTVCCIICPTRGFVNVFLLYKIVINIIMKSTKYSALVGSHGDGCLGDGHLLQHLLQTHSRHILTLSHLHTLNTWVCEDCCKIKKELRLLGQTTDDDQMKPSAQNASSIVGRAKDSQHTQGELVRTRATWQASTNNGFFLWRIPEVARRRRDAINERITIILYS